MNPTNLERLIEFFGARGRHRRAAVEPVDSRLAHRLRAAHPNRAQPVRGRSGAGLVGRG